MRTWKLENAKNRFSEVVRRAVGHEPQLVTQHGRNAVVVLSAEDYDELVTPGDLIKFLRDSPLTEAFAAGKLDLSRAGARNA